MARPLPHRKLFTSLLISGIVDWGTPTTTPYRHFFKNLAYPHLALFMIHQFVMLVNAANMLDFPFPPLVQQVLFLLNYFIVIYGHLLYLVFLVLNII